MNLLMSLCNAFYAQNADIVRHCRCIHSHKPILRSTLASAWEHHYKSRAVEDRMMYARQSYSSRAVISLLSAA